MLRGELTFEQPASYNIAVDMFPMMGRNHTEGSKQKISETKKAAAKAISKELSLKLSQAHKSKRLADPEEYRKIKYLFDNDHLSYAERGRAIGLDASDTRKLYISYAGYFGRVVEKRSFGGYDRGIQYKLDHILANPDKTFTKLAEELECSASGLAVLARRHNLR